MTIDREFSEVTAPYLIICDYDSIGGVADKHLSECSSSPVSVALC